MKSRKILGLAAVAATALMVFMGAGTASAETTLCTATETPCATNHVPVGTVIEAVGTEGGGVSRPTITGPTGNTHCDSAIKFTLETTTTPTGVVSAANLAWSKCDTGALVTITGGKVVFHHDSEHNGIATLEGFVLRTENAGITCFYASETSGGNPVSGTFTGGSVGSGTIIHSTAEWRVLDTATHDSSAFCALAEPWHASFKLTTPVGKSIYISTT